jgi:predicted nucleic acid-binding protein
MLYADSCYLVKFYCTEPGSDETRKALSSQQVVCLALGQVELVATFHRKVREGAIDSIVLSKLMRQLRADNESGLWTWLPVTNELLAQVSATFAKLPKDVYLRTLDALHLEAARSAGLKEIYSSDRHLLAAASHFGLRGRNVISMS